MLIYGIGFSTLCLKLFESHTNRDGHKSKDPSWLFLVMFLVVVSDLIRQDSCDLFVKCICSCLVGFLKTSIPPKKRLALPKIRVPQRHFPLNMARTWRDSSHCSAQGLGLSPLGAGDCGQPTMAGFWTQRRTHWNDHWLEIVDGIGLTTYILYIIIRHIKFGLVCDWKRKIFRINALGTSRHYQVSFVQVRRGQGTRSLHVLITE